jgi:hypothetical protein
VVRVVPFNRYIGWDEIRDVPTRFVSYVFRDGYLVTMHPGLPRYNP